MPCAAGVRCKVPGQTPGPPFYTIDKCRKCRGYLHTGLFAERRTPSKTMIANVCVRGTSGSKRQDSGDTDDDLGLGDTEGLST